MIDILLSFLITIFSVLFFVALAFTIDFLVKMSPFMMFAVIPFLVCWGLIYILIMKKK